MKLEGTAAGGNDVEKSTEVYEAPAGFHAPADAKEHAKQRLESLGSTRGRSRFRSGSLALAPGLAVTLELDPATQGAARPRRTLTVGLARGRLAASAMSSSRRRSRPTSCPASRGSRRDQSCTESTRRVTGPAGQEIHTTRRAVFHLHFPWDR